MTGTAACAAEIMHLTGADVRRRGCGMTAEARCHNPAYLMFLAARSPMIMAFKVGGMAGGTGAAAKMTACRTLQRCNRRLGVGMTGGTAVGCMDAEEYGGGMTAGAGQFRNNPCGVINHVQVDPIGMTIETFDCVGLTALGDGILNG